MASSGLIVLLGPLPLKLETSLITWGDTSETTDENDLVDLVLVDLSIDEDPADGLRCHGRGPGRALRGAHV